MVWGNVAVTVRSKTQMGKTHVFSTLEFQRRENQRGEFKRGGIGNLSIFVQTINVGETLKIFLPYFFFHAVGTDCVQSTMRDDRNVVAQGRCENPMELSV